MDQFKETLRSWIELLPETLQPYWLVLVGVAALIVLVPLAWYKRRLLRRLIGLPPRPIKEPPKLDEELTQLAPPSGLPGARQLFIEGVPARIRVVVVASLGKGSSIDESAVPDLLDQVRWGLAAMARQDQAVIRIWPTQLSAHGFPAVFHRNMHKAEPPDQPSHWVLIAGPTPPRPRIHLLGLAVWTEDPTTIGHLTVDANEWIRMLHIENKEAAEGTAVASAPEPAAPLPPGNEHTPVPAPAGPLDEGDLATNHVPAAPKTETGQQA